MHFNYCYEALWYLSCDPLSLLQGHTALHAGAASGSPEVVQMLLASGARQAL